MTNKIEQINSLESENQTTIESKKTKQKALNMAETHNIETTLVGIPGEQKYEAETIDGQNVEVAFIAGGETTELMSRLISEYENESLTNSKEKDVLEKGQEAEETSKKSKKEFEDIQKLASIFEKASHEFLIVKPESVANFENHDFVFMMTPKNKDLVQSTLRDLGYTVTEKGEKGFSAQSSLINIGFLYPLEKHGHSENDEEEQAEY